MPTLSGEPLVFNHGLLSRPVPPSSHVVVLRVLPVVVGDGGVAD